MPPIPFGHNAMPIAYMSLLIAGDELADRFAWYFDKKIGTLISKANLEDRVYISQQKVNSANKLFMDTESIIDCI